MGHGFGNENMVVTNGCNLNKNSHSHLGYGGSYETNNQKEPYKYLAGESNFQVVEFEVYALI